MTVKSTPTIFIVMLLSAHAMAADLAVAARERGKAGVLLWKLDAPPRKTVGVHHWYTVRYPRDRVMQSGQSSGDDGASDR